MQTRILARCVPHTTAQKLGAALGRVAYRSRISRRRQVKARLHAAFPELSKVGLSRLAREAYVHRIAARFDGASARRFDTRALCKRLTLEGWGHLEAAQGQGQGLLILGASLGSWPIAALAVALYRGPVETLGPWRSDPVFGPLADGFERRVDSRLFGELAGGEQLEWSLRAGDRVGFLADSAIGHGEAIRLPFLGQTLRTQTGVARASIDTDTPVVPIFGRLRHGGGWCVEVHPPIQPSGTDPEALTDLYLTVVEDAVRSRPELWLGWWSDSSR